MKDKAGRRVVTSFLSEPKPSAPVSEGQTDLAAGRKAERGELEQQDEKGRSRQEAQVTERLAARKEGAK